MNTQYVISLLALSISIFDVSFSMDQNRGFRRTAAALEFDTRKELKRLPSMHYIAPHVAAQEMLSRDESNALLDNIIQRRAGTLSKEGLLDDELVQAAAQCRVDEILNQPLSSRPRFEVGSLREIPVRVISLDDEIGLPLKKTLVQSSGGARALPSPASPFSSRRLSRKTFKSDPNLFLIAEKADEEGAVPSAEVSSSDVRSNSSSQSLPISLVCSDVESGRTSPLPPVKGVMSWLDIPKPELPQSRASLPPLARKKQ